MRGLAEFVMTGRKQAILAAVLIGLVPLVNLCSPVLVGLIVLRRGMQEATPVLAFAILPLAMWAMAGDIVPLIMLLGISALAWLLRETESWEFTLLAAIGVGAAVEVYLRLQPGVLDMIFQQLVEYLESSNVLQQADPVQLDALRAMFTSFVGAVYMFLAVLLLMWSRWLQAALYNPGGFQKEFHGLRIEPKVGLVIVALVLLANLGILMQPAWVLYLVLPLVFAGVALIHAVVAKRGLSSMWLVAFYALLMLPWVLQMVILLALIDTWYDFRSRLSAQS